MADNLTLNAGSGGSDLATDDIAGVHYQIVKEAYGALDSATLAASGAGAVSAGVQRVTLASDDPAVTDLAAIEIATEAIQAAVEGTLTVGSHAVTNAGTFAVQESGTHVQVDDAAFTPATSKIVMVGAEFDDTTPDSVDEGDGGAIRMSANRNLYVTLRDAAGNERGLNVDANGAIAITDGSGSITVDNAGLTELAAAINASSQMDVNIAASNATVTVSGTVTANLSATDNQVLDNIDADTSAIQTATEAIQAAVEAAGGLVVNLGANNDVTVTGTVDLGATDNGVLDAIAASLALLDNAIPSGNELQVDVVGALPAGTNNIGDVDVLSIAAGTNAIGNVGLVPRTSGGMSIFRSIDIDESEEEVKATAGQLFSIAAFNTTAAPLYLKFYNLTAANTTVGTSTPVLTFVVPGNADSDGAGFVWNNEIGFAFSTAISVACTTGVADNDSGAPGANACIINLGYA